MRSSTLPVLSAWIMERRDLVKELGVECSWSKNWVSYKQNNWAAVRLPLLNKKKYNMLRYVN